MKHFIMALLLGVSGCAGFRADSVSPAPDWSVLKKAKPVTIQFISHFEQTINGVKTQNIKSSPDDLKAIIAQQLLESKAFEKKDKPKYQLEFHMHNIGESNPTLTGVSAVFLALIPVKSVDQYQLTLTVKDSKGKMLKKFQSNATVNTWMQTFLIFLAPFKWPFNEINQAMQDVTREVLASALKDGVFKP